jgi:serine/threonine-protein kinase/endoribonuclease IRE1
MLRRPPGEGRLVAQQRRVFLALAVILLPWIQVVDAQQQQRRQPSTPHHVPVAAHILNDGVDVADQHESRHPDPRRESPFEGDGVADGFASTSQSAPIQVRKPRDTQTPQRDGPLTSADGHAAALGRFDNLYIPHDASAIATLAPDSQSVRAPSPPEQWPGLLQGAGLSSPQSARSLEDWEVEDFVLLATVDGHLYAVDRGSGDERWHLQVEQPVVETVHYRPNDSLTDEESPNHTSHPLDDYIWAVEPSRNGALFVWTLSGLNAGLTNTGLTMKEIVDRAPYAVPDPPVVYNGYKKTTMVTLDAATGRVLKWFGQTGSQVDQSATCYRPEGGGLLDNDLSDECHNSGTITLSRIDYTVAIIRRDDARQIATLTYSEWGPNNFDSDLHQQHHTAHHNRYITSKTDGKLYALDTSGPSSLSLKSSVPVVQTFDISRPNDVPAGNNPDLVVLPQPAAPAVDETAAHARGQYVFLNQTETGSWYAMSGVWYPLILEAPVARINRKHWWDTKDHWERLDEVQVGDALVGVHALGNSRKLVQRPSSLPLGLPSASDNGGAWQPHDKSDDSTLSNVYSEDDSGLSVIVDRVNTLPQYAADSFRELFRNPIALAALGIILAIYAKSVIRWCKEQVSRVHKKEQSDDSAQQSGDEGAYTTPKPADRVEQDTAKPQENLGHEAVVDPTVKKAEQHEDITVSDKSASPIETILETGDGDGDRDKASSEQSPEKKKKAHRGRRGGVKHRKGVKKQRDVSENRSDTALPGIDETIPGLQNIGQPAKLEPNVTTMSNDPEDVSGPVVQIGGIEVNQDEQLGMGSNGTVVFSGKFHGRDVAVKRMLTQFWDIATQETQLLLESDHHPNVIRYFAMSRNDSFLYIALELCQASLSDIIDKPHMFQELAQAGETDLPRVLLQIAHGLSFLHDLRIVHRDLKPQNILVTMGRDGKPRLLVSDFGLCKKLEGGQSSFGATTAHAAGTSGWRAPELLLDDDARETSMSMTTSTMTSTHSDSSQLVSSDVMPNRRATRSIDIFSLGLVFF